MEFIKREILLFCIIDFMDFITRVLHILDLSFNSELNPSLPICYIYLIFDLNILSKSLNNCFLAFTFCLDILYINVKFYIFICCEIYLYLSKLSFLSV